MKKHLLFWLLVTFLSVSLSAQTVYVTNTGEKYHNGSCRYLSKSKIAIELAEALNQGYVACKVCRPTQTVNAKQEKINKKPETTKEPETKNAESTQCTGTTKKGTRCKHWTYSVNGKCWQHGGS